MRGTSWMLVAALVGMSACGGGEEGERVDLGADRGGQSQEGARASWSPELRLLVDSANTAYAEGDYQTAADIYRGLTEDQPDLGVAWFGLAMAERALGNEEAANEAMERSEALAPGLGRMHDAATDSAQRAPGMPQGHPTMPPGHPPVDGGDADAGADGGLTTEG